MSRTPITPDYEWIPRTEMMSTTPIPSASNSDVSTISIKSVENVNGKTKHNVPFSYTYGSVCLLCLRTKTCTSVKSEPEKHHESRLACVKYVVLLSRHLKLDTDLTKLAKLCYFNPGWIQGGANDGGDCQISDIGGDIKGKEEAGKFIVCDVCLPLAESFCKTYQECELLKMKLEAKVLESVECVTKSEVLTEGLKAIKGVKTKGGSKKEDVEDDVLLSFRNKLKLEGSNVIKKSGPRLRLKRDNKAEELVQIQKKIPKLPLTLVSPVGSEKSGASEAVEIKEEFSLENDGASEIDEFEKSLADEGNGGDVGTTPRSATTAVQIVRRIPGQSKAPDIKIIRLPKEVKPTPPSKPPPVENDNNNNDSDVEVIDIVENKKRKVLVHKVNAARRKGTIAQTRNRSGIVFSAPSPTSQRSKIPMPTSPLQVNPDSSTAQSLKRTSPINRAKQIVTPTTHVNESPSNTLGHAKPGRYQVSIPAPPSPEPSTISRAIPGRNHLVIPTPLANMSPEQSSISSSKQERFQVTSTVQPMTPTPYSIGRANTKVERSQVAVSSQLIDVLPTPTYTPGPKSRTKPGHYQVAPPAPAQAAEVLPTPAPVYTPGPKSQAKQARKQIVIPTPVIPTPLPTYTPGPKSRAKYGRKQVATPTPPNGPSASCPVSVVPKQVQIQYCNINGCGSTFPKTEIGLMDILRHLDTHEGFQCAQCSEILSNPFELMTHELKHEEANPTRKAKQGFQCPRCPHYSMFRTEYQEHFLERHLGSKIELLKCNLCKRGFSHRKEKQYRIHIANSHPNESKDDLSQCYSCMICRVFFKKKTNLWKHLKNDHRINCQDGSHKCPQCTDSFAFHNLLELHREFACESIQRYACLYPGCVSTFIREDLLKKHLEKTHDSTYPLPECPVCKQTFYDVPSMTNHVITHNGEQVKFVFPEVTQSNHFQDYQDPQVFPVVATATCPISQNALPVPVQPVHDYTQEYNWASSMLVPSTMNVPAPTPIPQPAMVSLPVSTQLPMAFTSSTSFQPVVPVPTSVPPPPPTTQSFQVAEIDMKMLEEMFDESNDSEQPLMEFFENAIAAEGAAEQAPPPPDEDPFAWMLAEDFDLS